MKITRIKKEQTTSKAERMIMKKRKRKKVVGVKDKNKINRINYHRIKNRIN